MRPRSGADVLLVMESCKFRCVGMFLARSSHRKQLKTQRGIVQAQHKTPHKIPDIPIYDDF